MSKKAGPPKKVEEALKEEAKPEKAEKTEKTAKPEKKKKLQEKA